MSENDEFARVFKRLRTSRAIAQADFEGIATARYVRKLEKGLATPTLQMLVSLSNELRVSPAALVALTLAETDQGTNVEVLRAIIDELEELVVLERSAKN